MKAAKASLRARALQCLAQREHSRAELRRKLLSHVHADAASEADDAGAAAQVDAALDWLEANKYLSPERFVESRVHARAARFGNLRIHQELAQHDLALSPDAAQALRSNELERARAVWSRKFSAGPVSAAERGKQMRFLAGRGFSAELIGQLMRELSDREGEAFKSAAPED